MHITETFTLTDYFEYRGDISRDKKLHEHHVAFNSSFHPWKFSQEQKALFLPHPESSASKGFSGSQSMWPPRKDIKTSLSHVQTTFTALWKCKGDFTEGLCSHAGPGSALVQAELVLPSPAKPSRKAAAGRCLALLGVVRAFNLLRTAIWLFTCVGGMASSTGALTALSLCFCRRSRCWGGAGSHRSHTPPPSGCPARPTLHTSAGGWVRGAGSAFGPCCQNHTSWASAYQMPGSHSI